MSAPTSQPPRDLATRLREIQERCDNATPGPWNYQMREDNGRAKYGWIRGPEALWIADIPGLPDRPDGDFIAHARQDIPFLLAEIARLQAIEQRLIETLPAISSPGLKADLRRILTGENVLCSRESMHEGPHEGWADGPVSTGFPYLVRWES
jgi:hypothetical protein